VQNNTPSNGAAENYGLVGDSPQIQHVLRTVAKLSNNDSPVLITGESGVGKELVARALWRTSSLREQVFLPVDSASLVGSLMESELFGYVKGAFTGAASDKLGLVRAADGGTLFLDEVGELTPEIQAKLLRVLQESEVRPIGATRSVKVRVRILAATNRDLEADVANRQFRKDLFYRLNVVPIRIPPLRERPQDIVTLARHFIAKYAVHNVTLSDEALIVFVEHDWPGNVRELENIIRGLVALKSNPVVQASDLPQSLQELAARTRGRMPPGAEVIRPLAQVERQQILRAVRITKGDMTTAAHLLGIGRTTLYRKLKLYAPQAGDDPALGDGSALLFGA
jgi:two-component system response regulator HydG